MHTTRDRLTRSALLNLLRGDGKNGKHLNNNLHNHVHHPGGRWQFDVRVQPSEEVFYALENASECNSAGGIGLRRLRETSATARNIKESKILTERRTPIPVNITPAGGYICIAMNIGSWTSQH